MHSYTLDYRKFKQLQRGAMVCKFLIYNIYQTKEFRSDLNKYRRNKPNITMTRNKSLLGQPQTERLNV